MGVPSVPLYLLIADVATKNWCRLTNGLGRLGQLWQVWQQPPRVPQTLDSPLHHPIVGTRYLSPRSPLLPTTLWKLSHLSLLLTWLVKGLQGSDQSGKKSSGHPSLLTQNKIPLEPRHNNPAQASECAAVRAENPFMSLKRNGRYPTHSPYVVLRVLLDIFRVDQCV